MSLKTTTRERRLGDDNKISYHVTDATSVMKKFLSHAKTKEKLCEYLAQKANARYADSAKVFVMAYREIILSNHSRFEHLSSDHEEADTKLILHAHNAALHGVKTIDIHSPDTDVFIFALWRLPLLAPNTSFVTETGDTRRSIPLNPIHDKLGGSIANALPGFHALKNKLENLQEKESHCFGKL